MKTLRVFLLTGVLLSGSLQILAQELAEENQGPSQITVPPTQTSTHKAELLKPGGKFKYAVHDSILSPMSYAKAVAGAGYSMAVNTAGDRGFGWGAEGFSRRFGDRMGGTMIHDFAGYWVTASLLHQDPRYYHSPKRDFRNRLVYAVSRVFVTHGDNGDSQFNASNMVGIAASNAAQIGWTPGQDFTGQRYFRRFGKSIALNMGAKIIKEFFTKEKTP